MPSDPDLAHRLAPYDGRIAALFAAFRSGPEANSADRRQADSFAKRALRYDATAVVAAARLGVNAQVLNDTPRARRLFAYAKFLSRREIQTQLWAIEDAVGRGNVEEALNHYDTILRTKPGLAQMLYPVLTTASTDPEIRIPLTKILMAKPSWGESFVTHVAANTIDPRSTSRLLMNLGSAGVTVPSAAQTSIIKSLIEARFLDEAWNYYVTVRPGADRQMSRDPRFVGSTATPSPLDWTLAAEGRINASLQRGDRYGVLDFSAPAMVGGMVIQQVQLLPPGKYALAGHSRAIEQPSNNLPYWMLSCRDGNELGRVKVPNSSEADGKFSGIFNVPPGCPVQILSLIARPSEGITGLSGQIDFLQLKLAK